MIASHSGAPCLGKPGLGKPGRYELIDGTEFARTEPTPLLTRAINEIARVLGGALRSADEASADEAFAVEIFRPVEIDARNYVVPAISVRRTAGQRLPDLVVEVRVESTDRYCLGPKRLVYGRARIAEYCFLDPQAARMRVLRSSPRQTDYPWPPRELRPGQRYEPLVRPAVTVLVDDLLPSYLLRKIEG